MAGDDLGNSGAGASATGVFGTVGKEPMKDEVPVFHAVPAPTVPQETEPVNAASSGGFTQLLRALNYDAVKEVPSAPVAAPVASGTITEMLRTMGGPAGETGVVSRPVPPSASAQVTSFLPPSPPLPAPPAPVLAPAQEEGSFTQLFQRLEAEPAKETAPEKRAAPSSFTQMFAVPEPEAGPTEPPPSSPGSFTQLFTAVAVEPGVDAPPLTTDGVLGRAPVAEAEASRRAEPHVPPASPQASPASSPGSFTQMFQALGKPDGQEARVVAPPQPQVAGKEETLSAPGSFTRMFQALETPAAEEERYVPPQTQVPRTDAAPSTPRSFTQMFRTLDEEPRTATEPEGGPGSFTQLFGPAGASPGPSSPPPSSYQPPFAPSAPERGDSGASQMFSTYQEPKAEASRLAFSPVEPAPMGRPPASSAPASGGLTQLLRALDQPAKAPAPYGGSSYPPPLAPAPAAPQAGSFTGVYGELGGNPAPAAVPIAPSAATQPPVAAGPSEFTRLINASALREAGLRGGAAAPAAHAEAPAAGGSGFAMPGGMPAAPHISFGAPAAPHASISGPAGAHASVSAAAGGQASFAGPHMPSVPSAAAVKLPGVSQAKGSPPGLQKYVPLLLILVIFLLLAILVAVVVLMKK